MYIYIYIIFIYQNLCKKKFKNKNMFYEIFQKLLDLKIV